MSLSKNLVLSAFITSTLAVTACTSKEEKVIVEKQAPIDMTESFKKASVKSCDRASCVTIQKDSLGRIFLLLASGKTAGSTPQWYDLKPLVVSFEKAGNKLALMAENYLSIYEQIETKNLIQTFEVVSEDEKSVTFDWGGGLKTLITQSPYDTDGGGSPKEVDLTESSFVSMPIVDSFVRSIEFDERNIELEQISKVVTSQIKPKSQKEVSVENREETLALNIQIRAYNLSADFKSKEFDRSRRVGFFVTKVAKKGFSEDVVNLITKWDLSPSKGPIVVRVSSAVPEEYVGAVREASLYWNKVFDRDVITVKTGVDPQGGPEDRSIFVRWIPWLDSGAAYAIGQSDPLTGEVLRAQVFMPSVFTRVGSGDLVFANGNVPVAAGAVACDLTQSFVALNKLAQEASDSQRLRLAQDSVRATVAHELGHALGLRHNFAGSYSSKIKSADVLASAKTYLQNPNHPGLETSTSIMDYVSGVDEILMASRIKNEPLSYDKMAMDWAYSKGSSTLNESISKYCSDEDISTAKSQGLEIYGCERFDAGNNPLLRKYLEVKNEKEALAKILLTSILGRIFPGDQPGVENDVDRVLLDSAKWSRLNVDSLGFVSATLMNQVKDRVQSPAFASLENVKAGRLEISKKGVDEALIKARARSLAEAGGYTALLNGLLRDANGKIDFVWLQNQVDEIKTKGYLRQGKTLSGRDYSLNLESEQKIAAFLESLIEINKTSLIDGASRLLPKRDVRVTGSNGIPGLVSMILPEGLLTEVEASSLTDLYLDLLNESSDQKAGKVGAGLEKEVLLPTAAVQQESRLAWAQLLSSKSLSFDMSLKKALVFKNQSDKLKAVFEQADPQAIFEDSNAATALAMQMKTRGVVDEPTLKWLKEEIAVLAAIEKIL